ncbi:MAG: hypothetical protein AB7P49_04690 [Bdellovibrionales bacterium]
MHRLSLLIFVIGAFANPLAYAQDEISGPESFTGPVQMVTVEPLNVMNTEVDGEYRLVPYRERRPKWGGTASLGYSSFEPVYYEPNFVAVDFSDVYSTPETPLLEIQLSFKRNLSFGSLGLEFGAGMYENQSDAPDLGESVLTLYPIRLGLVFALDALRPEPWVVPYVSAGGYLIFYREELENSSFNGNSLIAPYVHGGAAFMLDWIDRVAARIAYSDSGIEATYVFAEARIQMATEAVNEPEFSTDFSRAAGHRLEI